jgi:hypothetical protein
VGQSVVMQHVEPELVVFLVQPLSVVVHPVPAPPPAGSARPGENVAVVNESAITASATNFIGCPLNPSYVRAAVSKCSCGRLQATLACCGVHQKGTDMKVRLAVGLFVFASLLAGRD